MVKKNKKRRNDSAFTLLEIIVVITLLGFAAAIVVAVLNQAKVSSQDALIKSNLANVRQNAEDSFLDNGNYNAVCGANGASQNSLISQAVSVAESESTGNAICAKPASGDATAWAVSLIMSTGNHWCVDSEGTSKEIIGGLSSGTDTSCN